MTHIHDGCCLQLGIGPLPNTIGDLICQSDLKDLGLHAEMFCTSMMNMHELGIVNNSKSRLTDLNPYSALLLVAPNYMNL